MRPTHCIFESDRFPCTRADEPDIDPPPGRELAQALLDNLQTVLPGELRGRKIGARDWDHSNWVFQVRWLHHVYQFDVEASPAETEPTTWHLGISQVRGLLRAVFGFRKGRFDVDGDFLNLAARAIEEVAGCPRIQWITEDEAVATLWPANEAHHGERE